MLAHPATASPTEIATSPSQSTPAPADPAANPNRSSVSWAGRASQAALAVLPISIKRHPLLRRAWLGACAGVLASIVQPAVGKAEDLLILPRYENADIAPRLVQRLAHMQGLHLSSPAQWILGTAFHFAYGAGWGSAYAVLVPRTVPPLLGAAALGAGIYALAFSRLGIATLTRSERPRHARTTRMTLTHWSVALSYGAVTAFLCAAIPPPESPAA